MLFFIQPLELLIQLHTAVQNLFSALPGLPQRSNWTGKDHKEQSGWLKSLSEALWTRTSPESDNRTGKINTRPLRPRTASIQIPLWPPQSPTSPSHQSNATHSTAHHRGLLNIKHRPSSPVEILYHSKSNGVHLGLVTKLIKREIFHSGL